MSPFNTQWLIYAIASGGCAALNGAFAKLVTTRLTTTWATSASNLIGIDESDYIIEYLVRGLFLLLNVAFNGVMWGLFTKALTLSNSTVRVSVINTSANFLITAVLGAVIFSEDLPGLWWVGAGLLVAGSVIIGRRDEGGPVSAIGKDTKEHSSAGGAPKGQNTSFEGNHESTVEQRKRLPRRKEANKAGREQ